MTPVAGSLSIRKGIRSPLASVTSQPSLAAGSIALANPIAQTGSLLASQRYSNVRAGGECSAMEAV
jgi:hypothetical protein